MEPKLFSKQPALRSFSPGTIILSATAILILSGATAAHAQTVINSTTCNSSDFAAALSQGGRITFANNCTISTASGFSIAANVTLDGTGYQVVLQGGNTKANLLFVDNGITLAVNDVTLRNSGNRGPYGSAILNNSGTLGTLTVTDCLFLNNSTDTAGGGSLTVLNGTASGNQGDAIFRDGATATIVNSTFSANSASASGTAAIDSKAAPWK